MPEPEPEPVPEPDDPEPEEDWRPKRPPPEAAPAPQAQAKQRDASFTSPDEALDEARAFMNALTKSDKLAVGGFVLLALSLFLPWRETATDGDELGILTSGFFAALLGLSAVGMLVVRLRKSFPNMPEMAPVVAQVALAALSALVSVTFLLSSYDGTQVPANVGGGMMRASTPSLGAILGLAGAAVGLVGTVLGMKGRRE
jgi:hypothetical protein